MPNIKDNFLLDFSITHLNHGSFGACPKPIFENYQYWQKELEKSPVEFITKTGAQELQKSKKALANFINCDVDNLVYTMNPSYAINIVAKSFPLEEGDEILSTDHEYGALVRTWNFYCGKSKAKFVQQKIRLPIQSKQQMIDDFWKGYTPNTKAIFISQITSSTALIFPVKEICEKAKELGLITIVDGAHVAGHIDLDLATLEADIYTGACHKWMMTPKGSSFLYVKKEFQNMFDPLLISWGYDSENPGISTYLDYHEYQGTRDFSAFLTIPKALEFRKEHKWDEVSKKSKQMILDNYASVCDVVGSEPICPVTSEFLGQICSIPIQTDNPTQLKEVLFDEYKIEIPVFVNIGQVYIRISAQGYIEQKDIDYLKECLFELKNRKLIL